MEIKEKIYYLPGRGGGLRSGLGGALEQRGYVVCGREIRDSFQRLDFDDQVNLIRDDIKNSFYHEDAKVIANSYGCYLLLHALADLPPFAGRALLLSPILGEITTKKGRLTFVPPRATRIRDLIRSGRFPTPQYCEIHIGSEDWQSDSEEAALLAAALSARLIEVTGRGHMLGSDYVGPLLNRWLSSLG